MAITQMVPHGLVQFKLRLLCDITDLHLRCQFGVTLKISVQPSHDFQQGTLAGAVLADDTDLGAIKERQRDITQDFFVAIALAHIVHFKNKMGRHIGLFLIRV
jgi:hypothetical protein